MRCSRRCRVTRGSPPRSRSLVRACYARGGEDCSLAGNVGKVDLRSFEGYFKLHKNTSKTTLERALLDRDPSNRKLSIVKRLVTQHLYTASLPLAATQWQQVTGWAADYFRHDPAKEKIYLENCVKRCYVLTVY